MILSSCHFNKLGNLVDVTVVRESQGKIVEAAVISGAAKPIDRMNFAHINAARTLP